jgi:hypothetical protein
MAKIPPGASWGIGYFLCLIEMTSQFFFIQKSETTPTYLLSLLFTVSYNFHKKIIFLLETAGLLVHNVLVVLIHLKF